MDGSREIAVAAADQGTEQRALRTFDGAADDQPKQQPDDPHVILLLDPVVNPRNRHARVNHFAD